MSVVSNQPLEEINNQIVEKQVNSRSKGHHSPLASTESLVNPDNPEVTSPSTPEGVVVRPLTSTTLFSPPTLLPPVTLPPYSPLSPVRSAASWPLSSGCFKSPCGQNGLLNQPLQPTSMESWLDGLESSPSIEWDPYSKSPSFSHNRTFWQSRPRVSTTDPSFLSDPTDCAPEYYRQIQLVSTESSDLDSHSENSLITMAPADPSRVEVMNALHSQLIEKKGVIIYKIKTFDENDVDADDIDHAQEKIKEIDDLFCKYWFELDKFTHNYATELGPDSVKNLQDEVPTLKTQVKSHEKKVRAAIKAFAPPPKALSSYEKESLDIQKKLMEIEVNKEKRNTEENKALVTSKAALVREKLRKLEDQIKLVELRADKDYWVTVDDTSITRAMKDFSKWDATMAEADEKFLEFQKLVSLHGEPSDSDETNYDSAAIKSLLLEMRLELKDAKTTIQEQDKLRSLFSLETNKGEVLEYPSFSGEPGEDLVKFKEKMEYRFRMNQVPLRLQLEKLRETLKGQALKQVPDSTKDISSAWANLANAFGDPSRVLQHRINILRDMGNFPAKTSKGLPNHSKRVEFLLKLEGVVRDIVDLGNSDDELMLLSFNANTIGEIVNKFPDNMVLELNNLPGRGKQRMLNIQEKLSKFRADAQNLEKTRSLNSSSVQNSQRPSTKRDDKTSSPTHPGAFVSYNPPKKEPDCRICLHLRDVENKSPVSGTTFFESHLSNYITGCPQFVAMDMTERFNIIRAVKICEKCFHPDVTYS